MSAVESGPPDTANTTAGRPCRSEKNTFVSDGEMTVDFSARMIAIEARYLPRNRSADSLLRSYPSSARASAPVQRRASRRPARADICVRPRQAWRKRLPSGSSRPATDRGEAEHREPSRNVRTWSILQGKILQRRGSAVAETGFRLANTGLPAPGVRSDTF